MNDVTTVISVLELAFKHADNKIIIYLDYGNHYDRNSACKDFMFHSYKDINSLCQALFDYSYMKSEQNHVEYEFPDHFTNDHFLLILDKYKDIYVTNFPDDIDISQYEREIMDTFEKIVNNHNSNRIDDE